MECKLPEDLRSRTCLFSKNPGIAPRFIDLSDLKKITIGRVILKSIEVSRQHAKIETDEDGRWYLFDLLSYNKTFLNGSELEPFKRTLLKSGDILQFGKNTETAQSVFVYQFWNGRDAEDNQIPMKRLRFETNNCDEEDSQAEVDCLKRELKEWQEAYKMVKEKALEFRQSLLNCVHENTKLKQSLRASSDSPQNNDENTEQHLNAEEILMELEETRSKLRSCEKEKERFCNDAHVYRCMYNDVARDYKEALDHERSLNDINAQLSKDLEQLKITADSNLLQSSEAQEKIRILENKVIEQMECVVCTCVFIKATTLSPCGHTFCEFCVKRWKRMNPTCPTCREHISKEMPNLVMDNLIESIFPLMSISVQTEREKHIYDRQETVLQEEEEEEEEAASDVTDDEEISSSHIMAVIDNHPVVMGISVTDNVNINGWFQEDNSVIYLPAPTTERQQQQLNDFRRRTRNRHQYQFRGYCFQCGEYGHMSYYCPY